MSTTASSVPAPSVAAQHTPASICSSCLEGYILPGTPRGAEVDLPLKDGKPLKVLKTYVTRPAAGIASGKERRAVVLCTDMYGLGISNPRLMADMFADRLGVAVYVPDLLEGEYPPADKMKTIDSPLAAEPFLTRLTAKAQILKNVWAIGPSYMLRHLPIRLQELLRPFAAQLRSDLSLTHLGIIGYCAGGQQAIMIAPETKLVDAIAVCHPGPASDSLLKDVKVPSTWAFAQEDEFFGEGRQDSAKKIVKGGEFRMYKGTTHGFATRPNLGLPDVKKGWEGAFEQCAAHLQKYVVDA